MKILVQAGIIVMNTQKTPLLIIGDGPGGYISKTTDWAYSIHPSIALWMLLACQPPVILMCHKPLFAAHTFGTQQCVRHNCKPPPSEPPRCIKPVTPSKVCSIAPSLIISTLGSRLPLAASLKDRVTCTRQRLMSKLRFANTSNVASLLMVSPARVVMLAAMIFWWPFPAKGAVFAHRAIHGAWSRQQRICQSIPEAASTPMGALAA